MSNSPSNTDPYGSAADLPSLQKINTQLARFTLLGPLLPREQREKLDVIKQEQTKLVRTVDEFYKLLGERNWIFTDDLRVSAMQEVVETEDSEEAERQMIAYHQSPQHLDFAVLRLNRFQAMKPRMKMIEHALSDYRAGRYYSSVLVLLAVMDGFVQDTDKPANQNLNKRPAEDMVPWDSVAGHHLGLAHAHNTFRKGVYKVDTREAVDLFRNGIMHGMIVNFDNPTVASKRGIDCSPSRTGPPDARSKRGHPNHSPR